MFHYLHCVFQQSWSCTTLLSYQFFYKCSAITKVDARRINALDQWCLRTLLGIKWHQFVCN